MKRHITGSAIIFMALWLAAPLFLRADNAAGEKLVYVKPAGATERTRVIPKPPRGGDKLNIPDSLRLVVLCPDHTGLTVQEHPSIYWYMSAPVPGYKCRVSLLSDNDPEPLLEENLDGAKLAGIQRIDLKTLAKTLQPDIEYKISVAVLNEQDRPSDMQTTGEIKRIKAPEKLISKLLSRPTPAERAIVYARQGIWYDALAAISDQIASDPKNKSLHEERAGLLKQVDLPEAAAYDEKVPN